MFLWHSIMPQIHGEGVEVWLYVF